MAELSIVAKYDSVDSKLLNTGLKYTFPLWGIVLPIASAFCWLGLIWIVVSYSIAGKEFFPTTASGWSDMSQAAAALAFITAMPLMCLMASRLANNKLIIDKHGIKLPFQIGDPRASGKYIGWSQLVKIDIDNQENDDWRQKGLVLFKSSGKPARIPLARLKDDDVEKVLMALELWSDSVEVSPHVSLVKSNIHKLTDTTSSELSFTHMWEAELERRYCPTSFMPLTPGRTLKNGNLKVLRHLALGGLSAVYLCQENEKDLVVMKEAVIPEDTREGIKEKARELFEREAELLMRLKHPGIVKVKDYFTEDDRNYLLLEYLNGQDIQQLVKQNGPRSEIEAIDWSIKIISILKYLHEQDTPVIHRDLTPDNLVITEDGSVVIIDFGAANEFIGKATGTLVGKQAYIAPEQFRGKACPESDIYSFGCTLHYILTGEEPEALSMSSPRSIREEICDELNEIVECCTQMEPEDRYRSAAQLLPVLRKLSASLSGA